MPLVAIPQLAKRLTISESALRQWCRDGKIVAEKVGPTWGIPDSEAARLVRQFGQPPPGQREG